MSDHPINSLLRDTLEKIKETVDVNMIVGKPVITPDGTTVIPVSKISFGFGSGGSEYTPKNASSETPLAFGGGGGAGVTVSPVCFLVVGKDGNANILGVNAQASTTTDRLVEMIPGAIDRISSLMGKRKQAGAAAQEDNSSDV